MARAGKNLISQSQHVLYWQSGEADDRGDAMGSGKNEDGCAKPAGRHRSRKRYDRTSFDLSRREDVRASTTSTGDIVLMVVLVGTLGMTLAAPMIEWAGSTGSGTGALVRRLWYPVLAVIALFSLPGKLSARLNPFSTPVLFALLWFWTTLAWSDAPGTSAVRLVLTTITTWLVFVTVQRLRSERSVAIVRYILAAVLVVNYVAVFAFPTIGVLQNYVGNWQGIMTEKNQAGALCGLTCLFWLIQVPPGLRLMGIGIALAAAVFLVFTWSRTAIIMTPIALLACWLMIVAQRRRAFARLDVTGSFNKLALIITGVMTAVIVYFTFLSDHLLIAVQDPEIMSKRGMIWRPMIQTYLQHPVGGIGFGAFWSTTVNDRSDFGGSWLFRVSQGHNGFLDLALQTGAIGLILALVATVVWPLVETVRQLPARPERSTLPLALVVFCIGSNISETGLFDRDRIWQIFLMFALALLQVGKRRRSNAMSVERRVSRIKK